MRQCRMETRSVVSPCVENVEASISQLDQCPHHERQSVECRPRTHVMWPIVNVHLRCVDLQRHLPNAVDQSRSHEVVQRRPF